MTSLKGTTWTLAIFLAISGISGQGYWPGYGTGTNTNTNTNTRQNWPGYGGTGTNTNTNTNTGQNRQGSGTNTNPGQSWPGSGGTNTNTGQNRPGSGTNTNTGQSWPGYGTNPRQNFRDNDAKVLVLGAGPAGLQAVKYLTDNRINDFILIEGADQVGGKLKKVDFGLPKRSFETGAIWIYPPTKALLDRYGIRYERNNWNSVNVRSDRAVDITWQIQQRWRDLQNATNAAKRLEREIANGRRPDVSVKTALAMHGWIDSTPADHTLEWFDFDFEEGVQSKDVSFYGRSQKNFEAHEQYFITDRGRGLFSDVIQRLDADHLRLNKVVTKIDQSGRNKRVVVTTEDGTTYTGDYVLVTFSIGVLQHGKVEFAPPLPPWKTEQIFRYQMGTLDPIFMRFQRKFWGDEEWILHASERRGNRHYYPGFLNLEARLFPTGTNILVGFVTGEEAMRLENMRDSEVRTEVWNVLKSMFGAANVPNILEFYFERWATNPLHYGSFSTWPLGADRPADARQRLAAHVNRLFFAQDASDQAIGTVSGSVSAGERAARQIQACLNGRCPRPYQPRNRGAGRPPGCPINTQENAGPHVIVYPMTIIATSLLSLVLATLM